MHGPGIECGLSIGFDAFLLSFSTNRMLLFTVSLCLCPPGQNSGISNTLQHICVERTCTVPSRHFDAVNFFGQFVELLGNWMKKRLQVDWLARARRLSENNLSSVLDSFAWMHA